MTYASLDGYHGRDELEKISTAMEGKSYMRFHIEIGNAGANNCVLGVSTECEGVTEDELRNFFIWCLVCELCDRM